MTTIDNIASRPRRRTWRRFSGNIVLLMASIFVAVLIIAAVLAPYLAPYDPTVQDLAVRLKPPSALHLLGTDEYGRDILSRLIFGARVSLLAALEVLAIGITFGVPSGMAAGMFGGRLDWAFTQVSDAFMAVPSLVLALAIVAVIGPGLGTAMFAIGIAFIPRFFRVARASARDISGETFIEASRALGCTTWRIFWKHMLPNVLSPLVVQGGIVLGAAVTAEASLSFLGLGIRPPTPSWGSMLSSAYANIWEAPFLVYAPGVMIAGTVLAFTILGEGVRQIVGKSDA